MVFESAKADFPFQNGISIPVLEAQARAFDRGMRDHRAADQLAVAVIENQVGADLVLFKKLRGEGVALFVLREKGGNLLGDRLSITGLIDTRDRLRLLINIE